MRVIDIKTKARARQEAQAARDHAMQERSSREVSAMLANRTARLSNMRKAWLLRMAGCSVCALIVGGLGGFLIGQGVTPSPVDAKLPVGDGLALNVPNSTVVNKATNSIAIDQHLTATLAGIPISATPISNKSISMPAPDMASKAMPTAKLVAKATLATPTPESLGKTLLDMNKAPLTGANVTVAVATGTRTERVPNGVFEAPALVSQSLPITKLPTQSTITSSATASATRAPGFKPVNVAIDGVLMIQVGNDPTIRNVRVGERLPSGEVLRSAIADSGLVETSERSFTVR